MAENQVDEIKQKIDIAEVIGERVTLKRSGRNLKGLCPFHSEKTPSFFVTPEMQMFKCFGCGAAGDVFSFLQQYEGMTFPEALETLAKRAGVTLTKIYRSDEDTRRERSLEILHLAAEYYHYLLTKHPVGERARLYLKNRGVTNQSIEDYAVGYAPEAWRGLLDYLTKKKNYKQEELVEVGMVIKHESGNYYDRFRGRIMFPQKTATGQVVGFSGRVLESDVKEAKYINTPETSLYHKGDILYGLSIARSTVRAKDRVVIVEGELDVISSHQANVKEVVAVKGSALTEGQIHLIRRLTHNLILSLDADEAGQEAIRRAITLAEPAGINLRVLQLKGGKDPDEIAKASPQAWKQMVEAGVSVYQFYLDMAFDRYDATTGIGQKQISQFLIPIWSRIENGVEQTFWVKKLGERLQIPVEVINEEMQKLKMVGTGQGSKYNEGQTAKKEIVSRRERLERYVFASLVHLEEQFGEKLKMIDLDWFSEPYLRQFGETLVQATVETKSSDAGVVIKKLPEASLKLAQDLYGEDQALLTASTDQKVEVFIQARRDLRSLYIRGQMNQLNQKMTNPDLPEGEKQQVQARYQQWERTLKEDLG